jgi:hypothetical protein
MSGKFSSFVGRTGKRSISFRHLFSFPVLLCMGAFLTQGAHSQTQRKAPATQHHATIEQNGFFYGEEQFYLVTPPLIHVYYQLPAESDSASEKMPQRPAGVKLQTPSNRDRYFHEIFVLVKGKWAKKYREVSKKPDSYLTASSCDTTNNVDLPGGLLSDALPRPIKIKGIEDHSDYAVVVYSDTPDQKEWYSLKTALLEREPNGWHMVSSIYGGSFVHFCQTKTFHARFSSVEQPLVLLIYSGWSDPEERDFISIQSFLVREAKARPPEQKK